MLNLVTEYFPYSVALLVATVVLAGLLEEGVGRFSFSEYAVAHARRYIYSFS